MQSVSSTAQQARSRYRHDLSTLTYVTLDDANGGIVRNLSRDGVALQAIAALHENQPVRVRFELRFPRLRVDAHGEVCWSTRSGQCGIRFVNLAAPLARQIDEWIFANLLESAAAVQNRAEVGVLRTATPSPVIPFNTARDLAAHESPPIAAVVDKDSSWLSRPVSGRTLARLIDGLVVLAGVLLFGLIFLTIAHELPRWPLAWAATAAAIAFVAGGYWTLFYVLGASSAGVRLAKAAGFAWESDSPPQRPV
ncbi:MAG TPA: PilZ domain-containing protein [Candidatus Binatia bacterium]|nr:PilZ domain-containing protein [Candidatus Binatia bacterium]